jgi:outer membrane protein assembly factor BamA
MKASFGYVHDTYQSLDKNTNWSLFGGDKVVRENPAINDGNLNSFVLMLGGSNAPASSSARHGWDIKATLENAGGVAKGDYDFRQYTVDIRRYQPLLKFLDMNLRLRGGASSGDVPLQRSFDLGGVSTLQGYRYKEFSGTHFALVNLEFILKSNFADYSTGWLSTLMSSINLILFADAGMTNNVPGFTYGDQLAATRASYTTSFADGFTDMKEWKSDLGFAVGSAGGAFRIGAAWRLDRSEKPNLIVRFSRPF